MHDSLVICGVALILEALVGYPSTLFAAIGHPVTWIGAAIGALDRSLNRDAEPPSTRRRAGVVAMIALVVALALAAHAITITVEAIAPPAVARLVLALLASTCLAQRSLDTHVRAVAIALDAHDLEGARTAVAKIVGRDVASLDVAGVARAAIESLAENFADGVTAPTIWLGCLGLPGIVAYKAINTADSMIGHRTRRHEAFGCFAAKLDDAVNWPAARLAALSIVAAAALVPEASAHDAWRIMRRDARGHPSPNAGWPEAAMAGALRIRLGGARTYAGRMVEDAAMGDGPAAIDAATIWSALKLYRSACAVGIVVVVTLALVVAR